MPTASVGKVGDVKVHAWVTHVKAVVNQNQTNATPAQTVAQVVHVIVTDHAATKRVTMKIIHPHQQLLLHLGGYRG